MPLANRDPRNDDTFPPGNAQFSTTHWSVILTAGQPGSHQAHEAMATLCQTYWYPVYAFIRRMGRTAHDAQDLTQDFFSRLLEKKDLPIAGEVRARFRSFLLGAVRHFLANDWDRKNALKRGGGKLLKTLDVESAEARYTLEAASHVTAETIFERRWAVTVLDEVLERLAGEYTACGKERLFEELKSALTGSVGAGKDAAYAAVAAKLALSEGAYKSAVHRIRKRYRELLLAEIRNTVDDPADVEDELCHLMSALGAR